MLSGQKCPNDRHYPRLHSDTGSFAVFRRDPTVLPGIIVDINKFGLAFLYYQDENWPAVDTDRVLLSSVTFSVENVPLITAYDMVVPESDHPIFRIMAAQKQDSSFLRKRGVRYGLLSREQEEDIERFIEEYKKVTFELPQDIPELPSGYHPVG